MANVKGLGGLNRTDGTNKLIASFGNDLVDVDAGTGFSQNITSTNDSEFVQYLNNLFHQNYADQPKHFDATNWNKDLANKMPMFKYMQLWRNRLYGAYVKLPQAGIQDWDGDPLGSGVTASKIEFPSRVFYCDLPTEKGKVKWGTYWSAQGKTLSNEDNKLRLQVQKDIGFIDAGIKTGDPLYILAADTGQDLSLGQYTVSRVDAQDQITVLEPIPVTLTNASFWVGSNWFEVDTEDGDFITGLGENNDRIIIHKRDSLHRYDGRSRRKIKGVPGTTSHRSIENVKDNFSIYFHGSKGSRTGFYMYDGVSARKISNSLEKHIDGIAASNFNKIAAWTEGDLYRAWVGNITNTNHGISVTNAILTYDVLTNTWSVDPAGKQILSSTHLRESGALNTYIGDNDDSVFKTGDNDVFAYDTAPIGFMAETHPIYPSGSENINIFTRIQIVARNARGIKIEYKLFNNPNEVDKNWLPLGDVKYDKTEIIIPAKHKSASGIAYRFTQSSTKEPDLLIEKITTFYRPEGTQHVVSR